LRGELLRARIEILEKRNELLSRRNIWEVRLDNLLSKNPSDVDSLQGVKQIAKFYFRVAGQLKILADIQIELQLLDSDLERWPTSSILKKTRRFLDFLRVADTTSVEAFYLPRDSYFRTSRILVDTKWGIFSSLDKFYDHLVVPPKYEDLRPPPYTVRASTRYL
jgi:hypothetical protein